MKNRELKDPTRIVVRARFSRDDISCFSCEVEHVSKIEVLILHDVKAMDRAICPRNEHFLWWVSVECFCIREHTGADAPFEALHGDEIHLTTTHPYREFILEIDQFRYARDPMAWFERVEHIDVTIITEIVAQHRAEQGKPPDVMRPAEIGDLLRRGMDTLAHDRRAYFVDNLRHCSYRPRVLSFPYASIIRDKASPPLPMLPRGRPHPLPSKGGVAHAH